MTGDSYLPWGRVSGAHGINGNFKISADTVDIPALEKGFRLILEQSVQDRQITCTVRWCKPHGRFFLVSCEEIISREQAQAITGCTVLVSRDDLPALEDNTYYWDDIIGLRAYTREMKFLGCVTQIIPTNGNDVYVIVDPETQNEILIPAVKSVVERIDLLSGMIHVSLPDDAP